MYFIHNGQQELGPFTIEQLKEQTILPSTNIWCEGMTGWREAKHIDELQPILKIVPPPFFKTEQTAQSIQTSFEPPKPKRAVSILRVLRNTTIAIFLLIAIGFCIVKANPDFVGGATFFTYNEKENPSIYLNTEGKWHVNLLRQLVIEGTIANIATHTNYRDIIVRVTCYNDQGQIIFKNDYQVDVSVPFGYSKIFKLKINIPKGIKSAGWNAIRAAIY
jgi:hypothetical protein